MAKAVNLAYVGPSGSGAGALHHYYEAEYTDGLRTWSLNGVRHSLSRPLSRRPLVGMVYAAVLSGETGEAQRLHGPVRPLGYFSDMDTVQEWRILAQVATYGGAVLDGLRRSGPMRHWLADRMSPVRKLLRSIKTEDERKLILAIVLDELLR